MPETLATSHHLLAHGRALLAEARADRASWARFAPSLAAADATADATAGAVAGANANANANAAAGADATAGGDAGADATAGAAADADADAETDDRDLHASDRRQLAWALQYDATPQDAELIRAALTHEVSWRKLDPSQGIGETLELLAWLVARDRRRDDLWLLAGAKLANFDTGCGFDREHLAASLYPASTEGSADSAVDPLAYVRKHAPSIAERDAVLELLAEPDGAPAFSAADVSSWLARKERDTHRDPAAEPLEIWLDRALFLDDRPTARRLLAEWLAGQERDAECLAFLANRLEELGDHDDEATARDELLLLLSTPADRASERCRAAIAARRAGQWGRALDHLDHAALLHRPRRAWLEIGRGRFFVHETYELALAAAAASRAEVAQRALALAAEFAPQTPNLPPITLELQARAATLQAK